MRESDFERHAKDCEWSFCPRKVNFYGVSYKGKVCFVPLGSECFRQSTRPLFDSYCKLSTSVHFSETQTPQTTYIHREKCFSPELRGSFYTGKHPALGAWDGRQKREDLQKDDGTINAAFKYNQNSQRNISLRKETRDGKQHAVTLCCFALKYFSSELRCLLLFASECYNPSSLYCETIKVKIKIAKTQHRCF